MFLHKNWSVSSSVCACFLLRLYDTKDGMKYEAPPTPHALHWLAIGANNALPSTYNSANNAKAKSAESLLPKSVRTLFRQLISIESLYQFRDASRTMPGAKKVGGGTEAFLHFWPLYPSWARREKLKKGLFSESDQNSLHVFAPPPSFAGVALLNPSARKPESSAWFLHQPAKRATVECSVGGTRADYFQKSQNLFCSWTFHRFLLT